MRQEGDGSRGLGRSPRAEDGWEALNVRPAKVCVRQVGQAAASGELPASDAVGESEGVDHAHKSALIECSFPGVVAVGSSSGSSGFSHRLGPFSGGQQGARSPS